MSKENISQQFRLKEIDETKNYFIEVNKQDELITLIWVRRGGRLPPPPFWFSLNNLETVKAITLEFFFYSKHSCQIWFS